MKENRAKQFLDLGGRPVLTLALEPFQHCAGIQAIIVVVPPTEVEYCRREIVERFELDKVKKVVPGGETRQDSVRRGIEASEGAYPLVLIHDGVRPFIHVEFIERLIRAAHHHRAVVPGLPAKETLKEVDEFRQVLKTCDRHRIWSIQTPQVFRHEDIMRAHRVAMEEDWEEATDDAALVERLGIPVKVVEGLEGNIKLTTPEDLAMMRLLWRSRQGRNKDLERKGGHGDQNRHQREQAGPRAEPMGETED